MFDPSSLGVLAVFVRACVCVCVRVTSLGFQYPILIYFANWSMNQPKIE